MEGQEKTKMSKEDKKALLRQWKAKQNKKYILKKAEAKSLFNHLRKNLAKSECDHTLRFAMQWLVKKYGDDEAKIAEVVQEFKDDGGFCDCEVLLNCYERYELE